MIDFILKNISTICVGALIAAILIAVVMKMIKNRKDGKSSCGCGCGGCPMKDTCKGKKI